MKNASMAWGEVFFLFRFFEQAKYLLHPTSSGFESRATHPIFILILKSYVYKSYYLFVIHFLYSQNPRDGSILKLVDMGI